MYIPHMQSESRLVKLAALHIRRVYTYIPRNICGHRATRNPARLFIRSSRRRHRRRCFFYTVHAYICATKAAAAAARLCMYKLQVNDSRASERYTLPPFPRERVGFRFLSFVFFFFFSSSSASLRLPSSSVKTLSARRACIHVLHVYM